MYFKRNDNYLHSYNKICHFIRSNIPCNPLLLSDLIQKVMMDLRDSPFLITSNASFISSSLNL